MGKQRFKQLYALAHGGDMNAKADLWLEFEAEESNDARFAVAVDRLMPLLHNLGTEGKSWKENGVVKDQVLNRNSKIGKSSNRLWEYVEAKLLKAVEKGILPERP